MIIFLYMAFDPHTRTGSDNGNVIALSRSSGSDPEQYDGNRHKRNVMVCAWAPKLDVTLVALSERMRYPG